jgi:hypothetical protein
MLRAVAADRKEPVNATRSKACNERVDGMVDGIARWIHCFAEVLNKTGGLAN